MPLHAKGKKKVTSWKKRIERCEASSAKAEKENGGKIRNWGGKEGEKKSGCISSLPSDTQTHMRKRGELRRTGWKISEGIASQRITKEKGRGR